MDYAITVHDFAKNYGSVQAVKGIDFSVKRGSFFAFLGTNGAGKSTTIDTLTTLLECEHGEIEINGYRLGKEDDKIRSCIGAVFQQSLLDNLLTIKENLLIRGSLYHLSGKELQQRLEEAATTAGVTDILDRQYRRLSGGQRRRADIARSLMQKPQILFMDEPSTGLDPKTRQGIWETIINMQKNMDMTVFLTTHYMEEAVGADDVVIIDHGKIVEEGTPAELKERYTKNHLILYGIDDKTNRYLDEHHLEHEQKVDAIWIPIEGKEHVIGLINDMQDLYKNFEVKMGTMDEMFINIIGREEALHESNDK